ncbi:MAG: catechol O-methyltransferase, partial [Trebouxia sp. A1-2]
ATLQRKAPAEHAVLQLVKRKTRPNNPQAVLDIIDQFAWNTQWLTNIGDHKGAILDSAIQQHQPKQLPSDGKLYSMDPDETHVQLAKQMIDHAGVSHKVELSRAPCKHQQSKGVQKVDFVFLDHVEHLYKQDLQYLMSSGFLTEGAVVVADNVLYPGAPDYRAYVANSKAFATQEHLTLVQYSKTMQDIVTVSEYLSPEDA